MVVTYYVFQEATQQLVAEVDILLTLQQYQRAVPDTLASFVPYGTRIVFETVTIPITGIIGPCQRPLSLLRWDHMSATLLQVSEEVSG